MWFLGWLLVLFYNIILMLLITMVIATLTLLERKVLALLQRRVGPNFIGYRGRLQYIADALKLLGKSLIIPNEANKFWFITLPAIVAGVCYTFWMNSVWGPSLSIFEIEYNIVYSLLLSILMCYCIILTGYFSRNKYAFLASIRCGVMSINLELLLGLLLLNIVIFSGSFCFNTLVLIQQTFWLVLLFFNVLGVIAIIFLLETGRAPFDLAEAEAELVAGYTVEYGGFFFALYYLGEYFHLFFFSFIIVIFFFGGWEIPALKYIFSKYYMYNI